jgi:hypothetical protein
MGTRLPKCSSPSFGQKVKDAIPEKVREALLPLVQVADALSDCIQSYDQKIEELGSVVFLNGEWDPREIELLLQIKF